MSAKTMKNITRVITILFFVTMLLSAFSMVFGTGTVTIPTPSQPGTGGDDINGIVSNVIWIIQTIAIAAAVIMLMFVGIKFVTASPEGKAEIKKTAVIYVVGAILLLAASGVLGIIQNLAKNVSAK